MKLIKLHYKPGYIPEGHGDTLFINAVFIISIAKNHHLGGTFVQTIADNNLGTGYFVQEMPEQIIREIQNSKEK